MFVSLSDPSNLETSSLSTSTHGSKCELGCLRQQVDNTGCGVFVRKLESMEGVLWELAVRLFHFPEL